jgi:hypothetical protein
MDKIKSRPAGGWDSGSEQHTVTRHSGPGQGTRIDESPRLSNAFTRPLSALERSERSLTYRKLASLYRRQLLLHELPERELRVAFAIEENSFEEELDSWMVLKLELVCNQTGIAPKHVMPVLIRLKKQGMIGFKRLEDKGWELWPLPPGPDWQWLAVRRIAAGTAADSRSLSARYRRHRLGYLEFFDCPESLDEAMARQCREAAGLDGGPQLGYRRAKSHHRFSTQTGDRRDDGHPKLPLNAPPVHSVTTQLGPLQREDLMRHLSDCTQNGKFDGDGEKLKAIFARLLTGFEATNKIRAIWDGRCENPSAAARTYHCLVLLAEWMEKNIVSQPGRWLNDKFYELENP